MDTKPTSFRAVHQPRSIPNNWPATSFGIRVPNIYTENAFFNNLLDSLVAGVKALVAIEVECDRLAAALAHAATFPLDFPTSLSFGGSPFGFPTFSGGSDYLPGSGGSYSSASGSPLDPGPPLRAQRPYQCAAEQDSLDRQDSQTRSQGACKRRSTQVATHPGKYDEQRASLQWSPKPAYSARQATCAQE